MKEFFRKFFTKEALIFLLLINTALHYMNFRFEKVDLPNATKKLVIDTIKNEFSLNAKCVNENCRKEVRNLENVLDEISYASQLGRLDTISLILALFAIVIGFGAIFGFLHIKESSENISRTVSETWIRENVERIKEDIVGKILKEVEIVKEAKQEARRDNKDAEDYKNL